MTTTYCDYSDLPTTQCAHCIGVEPEPAVEAFRAKFAGACALCPQRVQPGERIVAMPMNQGYAHEGCA